MKHIKSKTKHKESALPLISECTKEELDFFISEDEKIEAGKNTKKEKQTKNKISDLFFLSDYPREGD
ncbi:MAG: hypothetical protein J7J07_07650 [Syntrophobacterales bacterium]|nr:hypothetical protein [Syntrophobacterales bacterium]